MALATLRLDSGSEVELVSLEASSTYGAVIEGVPTARTNRWLLDRPINNPQRSDDCPVHLIEPRRVELDIVTRRGERQEMLPAVMCVGRFESAPVDSARRDDPFALSMLVVVWFQHSIEGLFAPEALPGLRAIPWTTLAKDCTW